MLYDTVHPFSGKVAITNSDPSDSSGHHFALPKRWETLVQRSTVSNRFTKKVNKPGQQGNRPMARQYRMPYDDQKIKTSVRAVKKCQPTLLPLRSLREISKICLPL